MCHGGALIENGFPIAELLCTAVERAHDQSEPERARLISYLDDLLEWYFTTPTTKLALMRT